ncbi:MAG: hypothetical protein VYE43_02970 [Pseudomonadota bacterium]|nr:hypothetical protein [Pseudomonadota bacterium]
MEPDKKLLKKVAAEQKAIKAKSIYREEAPTHKDQSATSSAEKLKALTDLGLNE